MPRNRARGFRRRRISMTSLIDVIFLLLIFFMLTSTFSRFGEFEISAAASGTNAPERVDFLRLDRASLTLNGQATDLEQLHARLTRDEPIPVLVGVSETVTTQRLVDVIMVLRRVAGLKFQVLQ